LSEKQLALAEIVDIARRHSITPAEIDRALTGTETGDSLATGILRRLLAYIGGIFVFTGIVVYIAMFWEEMNSAARILITLGSGVVALVLAILLLDHDRYARAATPLFLAAAWLQPTGMLVAFDELGTGGDPQHALLATTFVMLAQQLLLLRGYRRSVLVFLALAFGTVTVWNALDLLDVHEEFNGLVIGLSLMLVTFGIDRTEHRVITPFWYFAGGTLFLWASFDLIQDTPVHILYLGVAALMIYISTLARSRTLLFVSTLAMMGYIGYFTAEYFIDSTGWPIALIFLGLVMIGLSNLALRINRKYIAES
jgi:hypothetical protein